MATVPKKQRPTPTLYYPSGKWSATVTGKGIMLVKLVGEDENDSVDDMAIYQLI
jgi:hypothetical protein